jgi:CBS domain-containing protein
MERLRVRDVMTPDVTTLKRNDKLTLADDIMHLGRIRHLPVLDDDGQQERLFHVDHEIRDLTNQYVQADQQTLSDAEAAKFLARGIKLQSQRNEILHNYIEKLKRAVPASVALRAWEVENKLRAEASALYLQNVPFVTQ